MVPYWERGETVDHAAVLRGKSLSEERVAELEARVERETDDVQAHLLLLGFYSQAQRPSSRRRFLEELLWLISRRPTSDAFIQVRVARETDPQGYEQARAEWQRVLEQPGQDSAVLANAAGFLSMWEPEFAEELLKEAWAKDPKNLDLPRRLGERYMRFFRTTSDPIERERYLQQALTVFGQGRPPEDDAFGQTLWLAGAAEAALEADDLDGAGDRARELLGVAERIRSTWNYGNAIHRAHTLLGRVALARGDLRAASAHLLDSARVTRSPQLASFGPSVRLARDLFDAGEHDAVLDFLDLCKSFWRRTDLIDHWRSQVTDGQIPDFGSNLS
jgi:tetratricopeptide (TPR) repeat protein